MPTDTVYGLAASLDEDSVARLYRLKNRPRVQPCQVLCLSRSALADAVSAIPDGQREIVMALQPGTTTCVVSDPADRFAVVAGDAAGSVGIRAPRMSSEFEVFDVPLAATSANDPGGDDPRGVRDVPERILASVSAVLDIGELPGVASAVVDLRQPGRAILLRPGPNPQVLSERLAEYGIAVDVSA